MKKSFLPLLATFVLSSTVQAQTASPDSIAVKIFAALKAKDEKAMVGLYPNKEQMVNLFSRIMSGLVTEIARMDTANKKEAEEAGLNKMMLQKMKEQATDKEIEKEYEKVAKEFRSVLQKGEGIGISWNDVRLVSYAVEQKDLKDEMAVKIFGSPDMKEAKGVLYFTSAANEYELSFTDVLYLPQEGGWYGGKLKSVKRKGQADEKPTGDTGITETKAPQPRLSKPATKAKTKSNIKISARKTATKV